MHVLLVEDDELIARGIGAGLALADITMDHVASLSHAHAALESFHTDVMILDLSLPDGDGLQALKKWRANGLQTPVLILTARDAVPDRVAGLSAGGDDYLPKPFDLDELIARLRALHRRHQGRAQSLITHGELRFDPVARQVWLGENSIDLPRRELILLETLLNARGTLLSNEQLKERLYGFDTEVESNAVNVHIHHLRRKLGSHIVETVRGLGFRLGPEHPPQTK
ncbi:MAG TPA: response regulator [Alcanivoracaceae bacterium]|nr:response regulator [Alcanivoracaceae bacterium]